MHDFAKCAGKSVVAEDGCFFFVEFAGGQGHFYGDEENAVLTGIRDVRPGMVQDAGEFRSRTCADVHCGVVVTVKVCRRGKKFSIGVDDCSLDKRAEGGFLGVEEFIFGLEICDCTGIGFEVVTNSYGRCDERWRDIFGWWNNVQVVSDIPRIAVDTFGAIGDKLGVR